MTSPEPSSVWQRRPAADAKLPDYAHPPLVRVSLDVWFELLPALTDAQLVDFERELGATWRLKEGRRGKICGEWEAALQDQRVIVSPFNLSYDWDGRAGDLYPHYPLVREGFVAVWNAWCRAIMPASAVTHWSVEYVNRIPLGTVWTSLSDCSFLKWLCPLPGIDGLAAPNYVAHHWEFALDQHQAVLRVDLDTTSDDPRSDVVEALWLRLSVRGKLTDSEDTFLAGFDFGREAIVRTFRQLMQPAANEFWGLKS